jgi:hypothetical protein
MAVCHKIYLKERNIYQYIPTVSERSPHLFKNCAFQELNCHRLACSTDDDFHNLDRKSRMYNSTKTHIQLLALQDGTTADVLTHPRLGHVFADNRVENR